MVLFDMNTMLGRKATYGRFVTLISLCLCVSAVNFSCSSGPADVRTYVPADALVYLETNDLGKMLRAITENPKFEETAAFAPDLSAVDGVRVAVSVTGFETSEEIVTEENSVLKLQPHFVAVAETNAWSWQAEKFVEVKLGEFVNKNYGGEIELDVTPKNDGKYFVWKAKDGRKAFAMLQGSVVIFSNDESAIDKCLAVKRGEDDSISKNPKIASGGENLARGYVSPDGVAQLSNLAGVSTAMDAGDHTEVRSFIARVLPEILRNSVKEVDWAAVKTTEGVEDRFTVSLAPEAAAVFAETMRPGKTDVGELARFVPGGARSSTIYDLADPQVAWRSILLTAQKSTDQISGGLLVAFSSSLFEPYGIENPELFLSAVGPAILTVTMDAEGENVAVVAQTKDVVKVKASLAQELATSKPPKTVEGTEMWTSEDGEFAAAIVGNFVVAGETESVQKCINAFASRDKNAAPVPRPNSAALTRGRELDPEAKLIDVLADRKPESGPLVEDYTTETRFEKNGIVRVTDSEFGLIGSLIERFAAE